MITWEQSSFICMWEDTDFEESSEGEEGEAAAFPLICTWGTLIFSFLLECED